MVNFLLFRTEWHSFWIRSVKLRVLCLAYLLLVWQLWVFVRTTKSLRFRKFSVLIKSFLFRLKLEVAQWLPIANFCFSSLVLFWLCTKQSLRSIHQVYVINNEEFDTNTVITELACLLHLVFVRLEKLLLQISLWILQDCLSLFLSDWWVCCRFRHGLHVYLALFLKHSMKLLLSFKSR